MKIFQIFAVCLLVCLASEMDAQKVNYLDKFFNDVEESKAAYTRNLTSLNDSLFKAEIFTQAGVLKTKGAYVLRKGKFLEHGIFTFYHSNGNIESSGIYEKGVKVGTWERYTSDGTQRPDRYYDPASADILRAVMREK